MSEINIHISAGSQAALDVLENAGFEAWIVGGFVRDYLITGAFPNRSDIDITTSCPPVRVLELFKSNGWQTIPTGLKHGTVTIVPPSNVASESIEVTTFRTDGNYLDGRHPDSVTFVSTIQEDLARRDFTCNALAWNPNRGLIDMYGGVRDIKSKTIRCVGDPNLRFKEDALRLLRGARFESQLGFVVEKDTACAMQNASQSINQVSAERIYAELCKLLMGSNVRAALMHNAQLLAQIIPDIRPCIGFDQQTRFHIYDVWEHIAWTTQYMPASLTGRWAAMFHDIGKPGVFFIDKPNHGHFYGHNKPSAEIAGKTLRALKAPNALTEDVCKLVYFHDAIIAPTYKSIKKALRKLDGRDDLFRTLLDLKRADNMAHNPDYQERIAQTNHIEQLYTEILEQEQAFSLKQLAINGNDLKGLGITPGPQMGRLLELALDAVINEIIPNDKNSLLTYINKYKNEELHPQIQECTEDLHGRPVF